jgi:predicted MPP superfamily phosphohydrolase
MFFVSPLSSSLPKTDTSRTISNVKTVVPGQHAIQSESMRPEPEILHQLDRRLGSAHARERLRLEAAHEQRMSRRGLASLRLRNLPYSPRLIRGALKSVGLYRRARANAVRVRVEENVLRFANLPDSFDGYTILHVSDLHVDMNEGAMRQLAELLPGLRCDLCVLTGDFRGKTYGPFEATLDGLTRLRAHLPMPAYAVLGNHDSILMVPGLEAIGIRVLLNQSAPIVRGNHAIHLAGIDDAHLYCLDDLDEAVAGIPEAGFSILLSHTPEVYQKAEAAGFDLMLSGHTHGGQICLPGAIPITLDSILPRRMGAGAWSYRGMTGYTSVGVGSCVEPVRLNCPPTITLHRLSRSQPAGDQGGPQ